NKAERDFGHHDAIAQERSAAESGGAAAGAQDLGDVGARSAQGGREGEDDGGEESCGDGEGEDGGIDAGGIKARQVGGGEGDQIADAGGGEQESEDGTCGSDEQRFGEHLAGDAPPSGAHGDADGEIAS